MARNADQDIRKYFQGEAAFAIPGCSHSSKAGTMRMRFS